MKAFRNIALIYTKAFFATVLLFTVTDAIYGQELRIEKIALSSGNYDELSPVFYRGGIVFCTNRRTNSLLGYSNEDSRLYKLFYSAKSSGGRWTSPVLFSGDITTTVNEGPATFNSEGTQIYFTRNNIASGRFSNVNDSSNKLGIFSAEMINGIWQNIRPFVHNNPQYTFATPSLSHDGQRIYFSSDITGGYGGMDIYYCDKCGTEWCKPENAGPEINTAADETYPFIDRSGKLYFSSDGRPGFGGKDIYYTFEDSGKWIKPVLLDSLINSSSDDYGIIVDSTGLNGYFTSDRLSSDDIFGFSTLLPEFTDCDTFSEPGYCFTIYDERYIPNDTLILHYEWNFGNGIIKHGPQVGYCFPGPGAYKIMLDITDEITGDTVAWQVEYNVILDPPSQLFLNSPNVSVKGKEIEFNTYGSVLDGSEITDYSWDFGEGFKPGISGIERKFQIAGKYTVVAGMKNAAHQSCVSKEVRILEQVIELGRSGSENYSLVTLLCDPELPVSVISPFEKMVDNMMINIDRQGIREESNEWLKKLILLLNESEVHLEIQVYNRDNLKSNQDSRELNFFLKNHTSSQGIYGVHVSELKQLLSKEIVSATCVYEFIISRK